MPKQVTATNFVTSCELVSAPAKRVLITIHGICDEADTWNAAIGNISQESGFEFHLAPTRYDRWSTVPFLLGVGREKITRKIRSEIISIVAEHAGASFDVVCHSNGTKIFADIVEDLGIEFDHVIFLASICMRDDAQRVLARAQHFVNDCGIYDRWPIWAKTVRPRTFDNTGTIGFQRTRVRDRFFAFGHSGGLAGEHFTEFILPILTKDMLRTISGMTPNTRFHNATYYRIAAFAVLLALGVTLSILMWIWCS